MVKHMFRRESLTEASACDFEGLGIVMRAEKIRIVVSSSLSTPGNSRCRRQSVSRVTD